MAFVRLLGSAAEGSGARPARRADRRRRGAHVRDGEPLQAGRHLLERRPALRTGGHRLDPELSRSDRRTDPRGRHQRGRCDRELDGRGDELQRPRHRDAAVLHLLLDVRLPAGRRPDLGSGRPAAARLPARCHLRTHDARRRGPAAPGRHQSPGRRDDPELQGLRPRVRRRDGRDRRRRHPRDGRRAARRLLLRHGDERVVRAAEPAGRRRGRTSSPAAIAFARGPRPRRAASDPRSRCSGPARSSSRRSPPPSDFRPTAST